MNDWNEGIANAIDFIESNLTERIDIEEVARRAYVSSFYFQKIFSALCGFSPSEYIRNRRLTLAAQELCSTDAKVIDVAFKYGYNSSDSFARAFTSFHGIAPSEAKKQGSSLKSVARLKIKLTLEGSTMIEYKIVEKEQFTIIGKRRRFKTENSYAEIPKFWQEWMKSGDKTLLGMYGLCQMTGKDEFDYYIADNYVPQNEIPDGYETKVIPAGTWAVFPCRGALPKALQDVNTKIWSEWLPSCKAYRLAGDYDIEMYTQQHENPDDDYSEIWIPVQKA